MIKTPITMLAAILISAPAYAGNLHKIKEPTETKGVSLTVLQQNALEAQIPAMKGFELRARRITFEAGASFTKHNHAERPGFVYVESGEIIENRNGTSRKFKAGDSWIEDAQTDHWLRNVADEPAIIIMVDLPPKE